MLPIVHEATDDLLRPELLTLTAAMITRLGNKECEKYNTIPILLLTTLGDLKARILEAHYSHQGLVIRQSCLFDFSTNERANDSLATVLGLLATDCIGDPGDPNNQIPTADTMARGGTIRGMAHYVREKASQGFASFREKNAPRSASDLGSHAHRKKNTRLPIPPFPT